MFKRVILLFSFLFFIGLVSFVYASSEEEAWELFEKGKSFYEAGNYKKAYRFLRKAIEIVPEDGKLKIRKTKTVYKEKCKFLPVGRTFKTICKSLPEEEVYFVTRDYYPNELLAKISVYIEPPYLEIERFNFIDENGNEIFEAGEKAYLTIKIANRGKGKSPEDTKLKISSSIFGEKVIPLGEIFPGKEVTKDITLTVPVRVKTRKEILTLKVLAGEYSPEPVKIAFYTKAPVPPRFKITYQVDDDMVGLSVGNGNGIIEPREKIELHVKVKNVGKGLAKGVEVVLSSSEAIVYKNVAQIGNLPPGGEGEGTLVFFVPANFNKKQIHFYLKVREALGLWTARHTLAFNIRKPGSKFIELAGNSPLTFENEETSFESTIAPASLSQEPKNCVEPYPNRYLLAAVVYDYDELDDLTYVKNDIALIKILASCYLGVEEEKIKIIPNPSVGRLKKELRDFTKKVREKDAILYFYYSGHGVTDSEGKFYLLPKDASIEDEQTLKDTAISIDELKNLLSRAKGYKVAFIDACRISPRWKPAVLMYRPNTVDTAFVFSTTQGKISNADREGKHSAFTRALYEMARAGLKNVDLDASGYVETGEILKPLENWLKEVSASADQKPEVWGINSIPVFPVQ